VAKLSARSTLADVARCVSAALGRAGIRAVLTGGACVHLYTKGRVASGDLDFVIQGDVAHAALDRAMKEAGFSRSGDQYAHPRTSYFVEFLPGPLAIGADLSVLPVALRIGRSSVTALSPTDSCRDRLAGFYHWNDRQSLRAAVAIATRHRVHLARIRRWSDEEGFLEKFEEFLKERRRAMGAPRS
jgi:hypothetical protein